MPGADLGQRDHAAAGPGPRRAQRTPPARPRRASAAPIARQSTARPRRPCCAPRPRWTRPGPVTPSRAHVAHREGRAPGRRSLRDSIAEADSTRSAAAPSRASAGRVLACWCARARQGGSSEARSADGAHRARRGPPESAALLLDIVTGLRSWSWGWRGLSGPSWATSRSRCVQLAQRAAAARGLQPSSVARHQQLPEPTQRSALLGGAAGAWGGDCQGCRSAQKVALGHE